MLDDKAKSLPMSGVPERYSSEIGFGLTGKHLSRLEKLARYKHTSLFRKFVNY
jgi:hypothetical protein